MEEIKIYKYETKSLDEFSVMLALGARVVKIDRPVDSKFYKFYLESEKVNLEEKALSLASKTLEINAYELLDAHRRAKSIIHSNQ